ncbi:phosphate ABC transporter permease subunit PstC [Kineosporia rhizophila]|uniref:phosphate ABC transporter permease subunit PstC n=1 Tax=Kineosporia TaxID=49184 RepID=UPI000B3064FD|nr:MULTISPECIES: phosphate ABC transporter permease subunit PstC [Kineosporia]MCE0539831.1 phosphate ABC transporter permease subunit PstC [Kineosporia rhizophila]GLY13421.1 phosphate transport system permease protein [Kineosporia sp. NBRC 101677]
MSTITGHSELDAEPSGDKASTGRRGDRIFGGLATGSGVFVIALVIAVGAFLVSQAVPALIDNKANFLTDRIWEVSDSGLAFGIPDLLYVTVISSLVAMTIAVPIAVLVALFLTQYAPPRLAAPFGYLVDLLAAVPSIVYGLWGFYVFRPKIEPFQNWLADNLGWTVLLKGPVSLGTVFIASIVLAIMILPIVTAISREVFAQTPATHKEGALALGATRWEMIRTAVLPFGTPGVISAAMLGLGRALGETVAVMIIVSTNPGPFRFSLFSGGETFASKIANNSAEFGTASKAGAFIAAGLVLFILTFLVNAAARIIIERRKAFSE